ncbi:MAG: TetR/AcrR family transcriptional regulator [Clostridiales bacterium]|nr:TetR/AcrR family transcriptional regulator [Clostridiales bacterium]
MDDTRNKILKATRELFLEATPEKVTMRSIADRCNISLGNLTYYFHKKEDIFAATFEELLLHEYARFSQFCKDGDEGPWVSFIAANYAHLKTIASADYTLNSFLYAANFSSARASYVLVSSNLLYKCLENTAYACDRESVWIASVIGCGAEFEVINSYTIHKGRYGLEELAAPCFSARMFLLGVPGGKIAGFTKKGIELGKAIEPSAYGAGLE